MLSQRRGARRTHLLPPPPFSWDVRGTRGFPFGVHGLANSLWEYFLPPRHLPDRQHGATGAFGQPQVASGTGNVTGHRLFPPPCPTGGIQSPVAPAWEGTSPKSLLGESALSWFCCSSALFTSRLAQQGFAFLSLFEGFFSGSEPFEGAVHPQGRRKGGRSSEMRGKMGEWDSQPQLFNSKVSLFPFH